LPDLFTILLLGDTRVNGSEVGTSKAANLENLFGVRLGVNSGWSSKTNCPFLFLVGSGQVPDFFLLWDFSGSSEGSDFLFLFLLDAFNIGRPVYFVY